MKKIIKGRAHKYGDNINTDVIIPARYCTSINPKDLAPHCLEDLDPNFTSKIKPGDILVAGNNFGCGSSREQAPITIKAAGVSCVIAKSFARIFFRNAINTGLYLLECPQAVDSIQDQEELEIDPIKGIIKRCQNTEVFHIPPLPKEIQDIINSGGMIEYIKKQLYKKGHE
jgi:3-isopropylmalate/(R)-2-methylmalate dehydratase small subunit